MKRAHEVSNVYSEVHFKQKQRLTIASTGSRLPHRNQSRKSAEDLLLINLYAINMQLCQN